LNFNSFSRLCGQRYWPFIAIFCIRRTAYAEAVENEESAAHLAMRSMTHGGALSFQNIGGADYFLGAFETGFVTRMDDGERF
jgi:hypothetical protein